MYTYCIVSYLLFQAAWPIKKQTNKQTEKQTNKKQTLQANHNAKYSNTQLSYYYSVSNEM